MNATTINDSHYADDFELILEPDTPLNEARADAKAPATVTFPELHLDGSLAGAGVAILLFMALFVGFLHSWFTSGS